MSFISSNIPAATAYGVYISQLIRYSRACAQYYNFLDRAQTLLNKGYVIPRLTVSLQNFYGRHDDLVSSYEICISQKAMDILP